MRLELYKCEILPFRLSRIYGVDAKRISFQIIAALVSSQRLASEMIELFTSQKLTAFNVTETITDNRTSDEQVVTCSNHDYLNNSECTTGIQTARIMT
jgi:hypothetical protein